MSRLVHAATDIPDLTFLVIKTIKEYLWRKYMVMAVKLQQTCCRAARGDWKLDFIRRKVE
jgi:hypothetical protein